MESHSRGLDWDCHHCVHIRQNAYVAQNVGRTCCSSGRRVRSVASLHGTYAIHAQGTIVGQLPPPFPAPPFPFGEAGIVKLDGAGMVLSGKSTVNLGGVVLQPTATGSYTVNSDCTGTITIKSSAGFVLHDSIVVTDRGRRTVEVQTDPFTVITRTLEKIED